MRKSAILLGACLISGCASHLKVYSDAAGTEAVAGIPFSTPMLYVQTGTYKKASKGGVCTETAFVDTVSLPLGPIYFVNVDPAEFGKTEFAVKFGEKGAVSEISMNTEPAAGDALKNAGELIKAISPVLGVSTAAIDGSPAPACDTGPDNVKYTPFADWQAGRR